MLGNQINKIYTVRVNNTVNNKTVVKTPLMLNDNNFKGTVRRINGRT